MLVVLLVGLLAVAPGADPGSENDPAATEPRAQAESEPACDHESVSTLVRETGTTVDDDEAELAGSIEMLEAAVERLEGCEAESLADQDAEQVREGSITLRMHLARVLLEDGQNARAEEIIDGLIRLSRTGVMIPEPSDYGASLATRFEERETALDARGEHAERPVSSPPSPAVYEPDLGKEAVGSDHLPPARPSGRMLPRWAEITGMAAGVGLLATGFGVWSYDGKCEERSQALIDCPKIWESTASGAVLVGVGAGLAVASAVLLALDERRLPRGRYHEPAHAHRERRLRIPRTGTLRLLGRGR